MYTAIASSDLPAGRRGGDRPSMKEPLQEMRVIAGSVAVGSGWARHSRRHWRSALSAPRKLPAFMESAREGGIIEALKIFADLGVTSRFDFDGVLHALWRQGEALITGKVKLQP